MAGMTIYLGDDGNVLRKERQGDAPELSTRQFLALVELLAGDLIAKLDATPAATLESSRVCAEPSIN